MRISLIPPKPKPTYKVKVLKVNDPDILDVYHTIIKKLQGTAKDLGMEPVPYTGATCSLTGCDGMYYATHEDWGFQPVDLCMYHYDQLAR